MAICWQEYLEQKGVGTESPDAIVSFIYEHAEEVVHVFPPQEVIYIVFNLSKMTRNFDIYKSLCEEESFVLSKTYLE